MALIQNKDKNGKIISYRAILYNGKKKVAQKNFKRKIVARKWLETEEQKFELGYESKITLHQAAHQWLEYHSKIKNAPSVYEGNKSKLFKTLLPFLGNPQLDQLGTHDIERFIAHLKKQGLKNATINRYLQTLKTLINYYRRKEYLQRNVVSIVGLLPEEPTEPNYLSKEEAKTLLIHADNKYRDENRWVYAFYLFLINTGLRVGEIIALNWDCIDIVGKRIIVRRSYCNKTYQIRETTKGRKIRYVGINTALMPELKKMWNQRQSNKSLVFQSSIGGVVSIANFKRDFYAKDLEEAGLRWIKIHEWRHSFASHFVMNQGNLYDLQKLLGHTHVKTTERYAHLAPEYVSHQTERVAISGADNVIDIQSRLKNKQTG